MDAAEETAEVTVSLDDDMSDSVALHPARHARAPTNRAAPKRGNQLVRIPLFKTVMHLQTFRHGFGTNQAARRNTRYAGPLTMLGDDPAVGRTSPY